MMNANVGSQHGSLLAPTGHDLTGGSFVAQANYSEAVGQQFVRVVSCNTTAPIRVLNAFKTRGLLQRACLTLI